MKIFPFFADAANLEVLTPPWLKFQILSPRPLEMHVGTLIDVSGFGAGKSSRIFCSRKRKFARCRAARTTGGSSFRSSVIPRNAVAFPSSVLDHSYAFRFEKDRHCEPGVTVGNNRHLGPRSAEGSTSSCARTIWICDACSSRRSVSCTTVP